MKRWIVVANASKAKVYEVGPERKLALVQEFEHPEGRLQNQDLVSDRPGRNFERVGMTRHAYETALTPKDVEKDNFSRNILTHLEEKLNEGEFDHLYIAAGPQFLGHLRSHATENLLAHIVGEVDKDLTQTDSSKLLSYFIF